MRRNPVTNQAANYSDRGKSDHYWPINGYIRHVTNETRRRVDRDNRQRRANCAWLLGDAMALSHLLTTKPDFVLMANTFHGVPVDILPALKDGDSCCAQAISA